MDLHLSPYVPVGKVQRQLWLIHWYSVLQWLTCMENKSSLFPCPFVTIDLRGQTEDLLRMHSEKKPTLGGVYTYIRGSHDLGLMKIAMGYSCATCSRLIAFPDTSRIQCLPCWKQMRTCSFLQFAEDQPKEGSNYARQCPGT